MSPLQLKGLRFTTISISKESLMFSSLDYDFVRLSFQFTVEYI